MGRPVIYRTAPSPIVLVIKPWLQLK